MTHAIISNFPPPFDNPAADIIIRSRDGVNFRVRSGIIAEASPIFSDMFTIPLPEPNSHGESPDYMEGKPVIVVEEDSFTLDRLLRLCYPVADPLLPELQDVRLVLAAALKYEMDEAVALMKGALLSTFLQSRPLAVWASACQLRLADETMIAARALLGQALPTDAPEELKYVTAGAYFRLVKFHRAGGNVGERFSFFEPDPEDIPKAKSCRSSEKGSEMAYKVRPFADIICRSSDNQEYHTHKIILGAASPVLLEKILALPSEPSSPLPILDLNITGTILSTILELCYPVRHDGFRNLSVNDTLVILDCARRLQIDALYDILRYRAAIAVRHPLATYLLASHYGLTDIAGDALAFLPGDPFVLGCIAEMETTPALPYHRLLVNRQQSLALASRMSTAITQKRTPSAQSPSSVTTEQEALPTTENPWLRGILEQTAEQLRSPNQDESWWIHPSTSKTLKESLQRKLWCDSCQDNVRLILDIQKLHADVRKAMDKNNKRLLNMRK